MSSYSPVRSPRLMKVSWRTPFVGLDVAVDGDVVVDVLVLCNVEDPPVDLVPGECVLSDLEDQ